MVTHKAPLHFLILFLALCSAHLTYASPPPCAAAAGTQERAAAVYQKGGQALAEGEALYAEGKAQDALKKIDEALAQFEIAKNSRCVRRALTVKGSVYQDAGRLDEALEFYRRALAAVPAGEDPEGESIALNNIGEAHRLLGALGEALKYYLLALDKGKGGKAEATILNNIAAIYDRQGEWEKGLPLLERALQLARDAKDVAVEGMVLNTMGLSYQHWGKGEKAVEQYKLALAAAERVGNLKRTASTRYNLARAYQALDRYSEAAEQYKAAADIFEGVADDVGLRYALLGVIESGCGAGEFAEAIKLSALSGLAAPPKWPSKEVAEVLISGSQAISAGEIDRGITITEGAHAAARQLNDDIGVGLSYNTLGEAYRRRGESSKALDYYRRGLEALEAERHALGVVTVLNNVGLLHRDTGGFQKAAEYFLQALPLICTSGDLHHGAILLSNLGETYQSMGDYRRALILHLQAMELHEAADNPLEERLKTLNSLAAVYLRLGEHNLALKTFTAQLAKAEAARQFETQASILINMGVSYREMKDYAKALRHYDDALKALERANNPELESRARINIGIVREVRGETNEALAAYLGALSVREGIRGLARIEEFKTSLAEQSVEPYQRAVMLLLKQKRTAEAFALTEQARARTFLDQLGNVRLDVRRGGDPQQIRREQELRQLIVSTDAAIRRERAKPLSEQNTALIQQLNQRLSARLGEYENLLKQLKAARAEYATVRSVSTLGLAEVQKLLAPDMALLTYFLASGRLIVFVVTAETCEVVETVADETEMAKSISWFRKFVGLSNPHPQSLVDLHGWLFKGVRQKLKAGTRHLVVVPHGVLHHVPFAALTDGKNYLAEEFTLSYLPSASVLPYVLQKRKAGGAKLYAVAQAESEGQQTLLHADEEAEVVAGIYATKPATTGTITPRKFMTEAGNFDLVHVSAHGELKNSNPLFSRILLAPEGPDDVGAVDVQDVYSMILGSTDLVVLSACETQLGPLSRGDDVTALNRAFIYAGVPTIIASLWKVDDEATSTFMRSFYTHLREGKTKAAALRLAQSETRKGFPHPFYWAAFALTGDPGPDALKGGPPRPVASTTQEDSVRP